MTKNEYKKNRCDKFCPLIKKKCILNKCMAWMNKPLKLSGECTGYIPMCKIFQDETEQLEYIRRIK